MTRRGGITLLAAALLIAVFAAYVIPTSPTSPAPPPSQRIKAATCKQDDLSTVAIASAGSDPAIAGGALISLKGCAAKGDHIICNLALTKKTPGVQTFRFDFQDLASDNFKEMHPLLNGAFLNLHCHKIMTITLDKDDWVWFTQEFEGPTEEITYVKLIFNKSGLVLDSPVEAAQ